MSVEKGVGVTPALASFVSPDKSVKCMDFASVVAGFHGRIEAKQCLLQAPGIVEEGVAGAHGCKDGRKRAICLVNIFKNNQGIGEAGRAAMMKGRVGEVVSIYLRDPVIKPARQGVVSKVSLRFRDLKNTAGQKGSFGDVFLFPDPLHPGLRKRNAGSQ